MHDERTKSHVLPGESPGGSRVFAFWQDGFTVRDLPERGSLVIGRGMDADVRIDHPSVSRRHARITAGEPPRIEDLGSSNGTRVAGRSLTPNAAEALPSGAVIEIGVAMIVVGAGDAAPVRPHAGGGTAEAAGPLVRDAAMAQVHRLIELVATSHLSVILLGETGVGKEVAAQAIHRQSRRAKNPFLCLNCAALPETLLEGELFGFERGAFTGAVQAKAGLLESADSGTVFLDEVAEMPLSTQAKLLRAIETRTVTRIGGLRSKTIDVKFVAATNRDLAALVEAGTFRRDIYYRLNGITIVIPPLRERTSEILPLARQFAKNAASMMSKAEPAFDPGAVAALHAHSWPGNVRELRNAIERGVLLSTGGVLLREHLPPEIVSPTSALMRATEPPPSSFAPPSSPLAGDDERERIIDALGRTAGNQTRAAKLLGTSRRTLLKRLDEYGLARPKKV